MIHTLIIFAWSGFATLVLGSAVILVSFFSTTGNFAHLIARLWARSILEVSRIKVEVEGLSNVDPAKPYIYMPNHQSNADIPVLLAFLKVQFRWLAKAELFRVPIFGRAMRGVGYISIDRSNHRSAIKSLHAAAGSIRGGTSVLIFPEGTRSLDGNIRVFKKGGFILAIDAGVPIVPVILHGTYPIMPKGRLLVRPRKVVMEILKPIETTDYTRKSKDELVEVVRTSICDAFEKGKKRQPDA
jgi:1-acyl-sn-glycerol-3-phosphate acyltransferase